MFIAIVIVLVVLFFVVLPSKSQLDIKETNTCKLHDWIYVKYNEEGDERLMCSQCKRFPGEL